ncbi:MAG: ATP-grasp domain-containing protein [Bacteroidota bacterium]
MKESMILFLAGGRWQEPLVTFLKFQKGHKIALVDPYPTSRCVQYADVFIQKDVKDVEGILQEVKALGLTISLVISDQTDVSVNSVAEVSEALGLAINDAEAILKFSNKYISRSYLAGLGKGHFPSFHQAKTQEEVNHILSKAEFPMILKPVDAQSSRGIVKLDAPSDYKKEYLEEALKHSKDGSVIIEQFCFGQEITVEGLCLDGVHTTLAISDKKHFRTGIASDLIYPSTLPGDLLEKIIAFNDDYVQGSGLKTAITHAEYIVDPDQEDFWLVEHAARGGGSLIPSDIVPWISGLDVYELLYHELINQEGQNTKLKTAENPKHAILHFFEFPAGIVTSIEGLEELRNHDLIHTIDLEFEVGEVIKMAGDDRSRQGFVIILANSQQEIQQTLAQIEQTLIVGLEPQVESIHP